MGWANTQLDRYVKYDFFNLIWFGKQDCFNCGFFRETTAESIVLEIMTKSELFVLSAVGQKENAYLCVCSVLSLLIVCSKFDSVNDIICCVLSETFSIALDKL